ncbi:MAG: phage baseplate assembly protein V [Caldilineaceae bacterium]
MSTHPFYAPDFSVKIAGLTLAADVRSAVRSLTVDKSVDTADMFTMQLNNADLRFTDSALFDVGKEVEIHIGYVGELEPMILGEITAISPSFPEGGAPTLTVTGYDKSHRMRHNSPPHRKFNYVNDSLIAAQIAAENLLIPVVDPSITVRESIDQHGSDWALLQELADRNYMQVYVEWDKLYFRFPRPQTEAVVLEWGKNLSSFSPRLSTSGQHGIQIVRSYSHELAEAIVMVLPALALDADLDAVIERLGSGFLQQLVQLGRYVVRGERIRDHFEAADFAKSILQQILEGLFEGSGSCIGIPRLRAGEQVDIRGVGKRFGGKYRLSKVTHTIDDGGYRTTFEVTQRYTSNLLQSLRQKLNDAPPPNKQRKIEGVVVGIVRNNIGDPLQLGRIQVSFPDYSDINLSQWAPIATYMAGGLMTDSWGSYFLPDINDHVLVAFEHGDINRPVIVGSLWHRKAPPPATNQGQNAKKFLKTKTGMQLLFDETPLKEQLLIQDKAGNVIMLDSKANGEQIRIQDKAGAKVMLDATPGQERLTLQDKAGATILLDSVSGDLSITRAEGHTIQLKADGSLQITAAGNINLTSSGGDITLDANNVTVKVKGTMDVQ